MPVGVDKQVLYALGPPADPIRPGQLLVDATFSPPRLRICTQVTPSVVYADVGGGGGGGPYVRGATFTSSLPLQLPQLTAYLYFPGAAAIDSVVVLAGPLSGSCVVDVRKGTYAGYPVASSVCGSAKPTIAAGLRYKDTALTGWTTAVAADEFLAVVLESVSVFQFVSVYLEMTPA